MAGKGEGGREERRAPGNWPRKAGRTPCRRSSGFSWHPIRLMVTQSHTMGTGLGMGVGCEQEQCPGQLKWDFQVALLGVPMAFSGPAKGLQERED